MDRQEPGEHAMSSELSADHGFGADRHDLGSRQVQPADEPNLAGLALQALGRVFRRGERRAPGDEGSAAQSNTALSRIAGAPRGSTGARN